MTATCTRQPVHAAAIRTTHRQAHQGHKYIYPKIALSRQVLGPTPMSSSIRISVTTTVALVCVLVGAAFSSQWASANPRCPSSWPTQAYDGPLQEKDYGRIGYEDFYTDSHGDLWFVIRSADSNGYTMVRAYPADADVDRYIAGAPDETCFLLVRRPGDAVDATEPRPIGFPSEPEARPPPPATPGEPEPTLGFYDIVSVDASSVAAFLEGPVCGLRKDGIAVCLGLKYNPLQSAEPYIPTARFTSINIGETFACGVKTDGALACWPIRFVHFSGPDLPVPEGRFESVSVGGYHACGIRPDASAECWFAWGGSEWDDNDNAGQATPPEGGFRSVSAGGHHTCGIRIDGTVACWGLDEPEGPFFFGASSVGGGQASPPDGDFRSVSAGNYHSCGIRSDETLECWGDTWGTWPPGTFESVNAGAVYTCGLRTEGSVACWGLHSDISGSLYDVTSPPERSFTSVATGLQQTCATEVDGSVVCWGLDSLGLNHRTSSYTGLTSGDLSLTCGARLSRDGISDFCWNAGGEIAVPKALTVNLKYNRICIIDSDTKLFCDGYSSDLRLPSGDFRTVSIGYRQTCAVRTDNSAVCWDDEKVLADVLPEDEFKSISVGDEHACGTLLDDNVVCWGKDYYGQLSHPDGEITALSAGYAHTCGLRPSRQAQCWGNDKFGQSSPPDGKFRLVSAGSNHTCGVTTDGSAVCWGDNGRGQAAPPDEEFRQLSASDD